MAFAISILAGACNAKEEETTSDDYLAAESVAITGFSLQADLRVMKNLDSVFFSIDLEHGVVFNADSLPKGTNVTKLIPKITYPSSVKSAVIEMKGGTHREDGTVNYYSNASDTIDFTADVTLTLATADKKLEKTYVLKVNVHQQDPDTVYWNSTGSMDLPSRLPNPVAQKSVEFNGGVLSIIQESDGTYTLATCADIFEGSWIKKEIGRSSGNFVADPKLSSLQSSPSGTLYIVTETGQLYSSSDGLGWQPLATNWAETIGFYGDTLLGYTTASGNLRMVTWPEDAIPAIDLPSDFPLNGFTSPIEFTNRWTPDPTIVIFGGYPLNPNGKSPAWAFDGSQWVNIAENALPALTGMSVVSYYSFLKSASSSLLKEFEVYLAFGGKDALGNINNTVYVSYDHGINWQKAQEYMQFPEDIEAGFMVNALSLGNTMSSTLSSRWSVPAKRRIPFDIEGDVVSWECPYIFLFGGYDNAGSLCPQIRSGVLKRLTFVPLF